jgi:cytochrome c oxidase assembly factor CtaG
LFLVLPAGAGLLYLRAARRGLPSTPRSAAFAVGLVLIAGALNSPLETIAVHYLLLIHLLQNVMIADWAPPLLLLGLTAAMRAAISRRGGRPFAWVTRPRIALPAWLVGWYVLHLAGVYDFALENTWALNVEHALLIALGLLFWWPVLAGGASSLVALGYLGAGFVGSAFLGLALTFATTPFYDFYVDAPRLWGLSAVKDQNLGGVLMSGEQALVFLIAIGYFVLRLLREEEAHERALARGPRPQA